MKYARYYGPITEKEYEVLAKGFRFFVTDDLEEALRDAEIKSLVSERVTVRNIDGDEIAVWLNGRRIFIK